MFYQFYPLTVQAGRADIQDLLFINPSVPHLAYQIAPNFTSSLFLRHAFTAQAYYQKSLPTVLSVALFLLCGIRLVMTLSLALHLLYASLPLRHSHSVRHLGLVSARDRNLSISVSGVGYTGAIQARLLLLLLLL